MKPLHKIPKEIIMPQISDADKLAMIYLHDSGYIGFRRQSNNLWRIYHPNFDLPDIDLSPYYVGASRISEWSPEWIRS